MKGWKQGLLVLLLLAVAGCVPTQRELRMEQDVDVLKRRLAELERSFAGLREDRTVDDRLAAISQQQAELQAGLDNLRVEFQSISGRIDDQGRERGKVHDELSLVRDDLALKVSAMEDRLGKLEEQAKARAAEPPPMPETAEALYGRGLELIQKQNDYAGGRKWLQEFLQRYPQNELAPNAMYWIGESWYGEKKYENAILQFQDVVQKYGEHPKVASALLKQGMAFQSLGDKKSAKVVLQKLIETFPLSEEAKRAKEKLAELGR